MKKSKKNKGATAIIVLFAGILALVSALIFPAISRKLGEESSITANIFGMAFGGATLTTTIKSTTTSVAITGGMSIFALISIIALFMGIALSVMSIFSKNKNLDFLGAILVTISGVLMLFLLTAGTDVVTAEIGSTTITEKFVEYFKEFNLAFGAILYAILAILGGGLGILSKIKK